MKQFFKDGLKVTVHFQERLMVRHNGLVTIQEVASILDRLPELQLGKETWVFVKSLSEVQELRDAQGNVEARGDELWIVCKRPDSSKRGDIVNLILRGSYQGRDRSKVYIR